VSTSNNLITNLDKVAYNTYLNAEKIVKTFAGSFLYGTSTTTRNYTLAGFPNAVQVYKIPHGFTRPVFVELLWSEDNAYYILGGAANGPRGYATAYSDSTFIYIMPTTYANGTRLYYKLVCTWIDEYDATNPSIAPFAEIPDSYTQVFNSRSVIPAVVRSGVVDFSTSSAVLTDVFATVTHGLGYAPEMKCFIESFSGEVWPLNYGGSSNPYEVDDSQVEAQVFTSTTEFIADASIKAANGQRRLWYILYGKQGDFKSGAYSVTVL
jgi:hypothetical protein